MNMTATLFGQMITFAILVWFVNRVLWRPLNATMAQRTWRIESGLEAAEQGRRQQQQAQEEAHRLILEARSRAEEIISQAREREAEIADGAKREAVHEKARLISAADAEIERMIAAAREHLRHDLAALVVEGAGRIIAMDVDTQRHHALIADLGARL